MLREGRKAPAFTLRAGDGATVSLSDFAGKTVVLYFYPRDNTPGCTTEAVDFQGLSGRLKRRGAVVLGVSRDSVESHQRFAAKHRLRFPLLSDPEGRVIRKYGAWGQKTMYGRKSEGIIRTTVLIGPDGRVLRVFPKVRVKGHAEAVLAAIDELTD